MKNLFLKKLFFSLIALLFISLTTAMSAYALNPFKGLPSLEELENPNPELASLVYSEDGILLHKFFLKNRTFIPLKSIPKSAQHALIATEDVSFYSHWGIDLRRLALVMGENLIKGRKKMARREHHYPAARKKPLSDPGTDDQQKSQRVHHRYRAGENLYQGRNSRPLPQYGLFRFRSIRHRGGIENLFRQAGKPADASGKRDAHCNPEKPYRIQPGQKSFQLDRQKKSYSFADGKGKIHYPRTGCRS